MNTASLCGDHIHMVWRAAAGIRGKEVVAQAELLGITPVIGDICLCILDVTARRNLVPLAPIHCCYRSRAIVIEVNALWICRLRLSNTVGSGKSAKEIIKGMIFLHNEDHMLDRGCCCFLHAY